VQSGAGKLLCNKTALKRCTNIEAITIIIIIYYYYYHHHCILSYLFLLLLDPLAIPFVIVIDPGFVSLCFIPSYRTSISNSFAEAVVVV